MLTLAVGGNVARAGRVRYERADCGADLGQPLTDGLRATGAHAALELLGERQAQGTGTVALEEWTRWSRHPGVHCAGVPDDVREVWRRAEICVWPGEIRQGLPRAVLEAAACGRPIVATDVPGCREIARHDVNAFLVPPDDPVALADAIAVLARDKALRLRLGDAGRALAEAEFSSARIGADIVALYDSLTRLRPALLPDSATAS